MLSCFLEGVVFGNCSPIPRNNLGCKYGPLTWAQGSFEWVLASFKGISTSGMQVSRDSKSMLKPLRKGPRIGTRILESLSTLAAAYEAITQNT